MFGLKKRLFWLLSLLLVSVIALGATRTDKIYVTGLTALQIVSVAADNSLTTIAGLAGYILGTAEEIDVTDNGDGTVTIGIVDPLIVTKGGTGLATATDGGFVLGSGTGAMTVTAQPTDGQLPIGATGSDPQLGTLTGISNEIDIVNSAGDIYIGIVDPLIVSKGGTGLATITDHSILVGSGTGAITPLSAATNGQIPIGSTGADPTIAGITGTTDEITVTNGAGSITLSIVTPLNVTKGGTGLTSPTDHSLIVGSGATAMTELGVATNGQIPIGSTGADPTLATITGTANEITITNGAGSITVDIPSSAVLDVASIVVNDGGTIGQAAGPLLTFDDSNNFLEITGANVGIGETTPTATLHLKAGTATASTAPLKLTTGVLLTTPEAGAIEFVDDILYFTTTTGPTRKKISYSDTDYGGMYTYDKAVSLNITTSNVYHGYYAIAAGDIVEGLTDGWTFDAGRNVDANVSAEADNGGQLQIDTSAAHNLTTGDIVSISNANNALHNSSSRVTVDDADTFTCDDISYVAGAGASAAIVDEPAYLQITEAISQIFHLHWSISGNAALSNKQYKFEPVQNATPLDNCAAEATFGNTTANNVSGHGLISVNTGDRIWMQCANVTDGTNFVVKHFNMVLSRQ